MSTLKVNNIQSVTDGVVSFPQGLSSSNEPLSIPDGTASSPSIRFGNDTDTGLYRIGENTIGVTTEGILRTRLDNNGIEVINGTNTNPSISFIDDTNTGIFRSASDQIDIVTGGNSRFRIESTGQIKAVYESQVGTDYNTQLDNGYLCRAWVNFNGTATQRTGTYTISGNTITVNITSHGLTTGNFAQLDFASGDGVDGYYQVTVINANSYTVTNPVSGSTGGNVTQDAMIRASGNVSSITDSGTGAYTINFTNNMPDTNYTSIITSDYGSSIEVRYSCFITALVGSLGIQTRGGTAGTSGGLSGALQDLPYIRVAIFR